MLSLERKYLIEPSMPSDLPHDRSWDSVETILQPDRNMAFTAVRVDQGNRATLCIRTEDGQYDEHPVHRSVADFYARFDSARQISYEYTSATSEQTGLTMDIRRYTGHLQGLGIVTVANVDDASTLVTPEWFGEEITSETEFDHTRLARIEDASALFKGIVTISGRTIVVPKLQESILEA